MKKAIFLLMLALPLAFAFTTLPVATETCTCDAPTNLRKTSRTATSITYTWDAMSGASGYKVKYVRQSDSYQSPVWSTAAATYTFTGLSAGTYQFYFATDCGEEVSGFIVIEDVNGV